MNTNWNWCWTNECLSATWHAISLECFPMKFQFLPNGIYFPFDRVDEWWWNFFHFFLSILMRLSVNNYILQIANSCFAPDVVTENLTISWDEIGKSFFDDDEMFLDWLISKRHEALKMSEGVKHISRCAFSNIERFHWYTRWRDAATFLILRLVNTENHKYHFQFFNHW